MGSDDHREGEESTRIRMGVALEWRKPSTGRGMAGARAAAKRHPGARMCQWLPEPASNALSQQAQLWTAHSVTLCLPEAGGDHGVGVKRTCIVLVSFCFHQFARPFQRSGTV